MHTHSDQDLPLDDSCSGVTWKTIENFVEDGQCLLAYIT